LNYARRSAKFSIKSVAAKCLMDPTLWIPEPSPHFCYNPAMKQDRCSSLSLPKLQEEIVKSKNYPEFKERLANSACTLCDLHQGRTRIVVDRGNSKACVLFIGEGPGAEEDIRGKAFVGRAGRLLDQMCLTIGIDTNQDALIANVVKCRPPDNRAPLKQEAETCLPYLMRQIELVRPSVIVLLGATALKHLLPHKKNIPVGELAGQLFEDSLFPHVKLMLLFHPAYILRDPRKKPRMLAMLKLLKEELHKSNR